MLTYLVSVTEDLVSTMILAGLALAFAREAWGKREMIIMWAGIGVALVLSAVMAVFKQTTNMVDTGLWNMRIFVVAAVALVIFLLCFIPLVGRKKVGRIVMALALSVFTFCRLFYKLPDVYLYPANFNLTDGNVLSTDFAQRIVGWLFGLVIVVLIGLALYKASKALGKRSLGASLVAVGLIIAVVQMMTCVQTMLARRIIKQNPITFELVKFFSNSSTLFMFIIMGIALALAVIIIVLSLRDAEPYDNPAQHRKNRAKWRNRRRWAICLIVCMVLAVATVTVVKDYDSRGPELSPSEECEVREGNVYVSLDQVSDGHLHRFTYQTEAGMEINDGQQKTVGGVGVRFIVIKKPNSSAFGVGLDACDICGETGYYERDGQVVCKLCDVVMNINTIGFKGGCNPIVIEYSVENGAIVVPCSVLAEYETTFK